MNDPRPAFMFNAVDFWSSEKVDLMDFEAVGLYLFLLSRQWQNGSIPGDEATLRAMCRGRTARFDELWPLVRPCFDDAGNGRLQNSRLERDRARADEKSAKAGGAAKEKWERWRAERSRDTKSDGVVRPQSERSATAERPQCEGNASDRTGTGTGQGESPPPPKGGESPAPGSAPPPPDPEPEPSPKRDQKASTHDAERVLREPEFAELADDIPFAAFWPEWLAHRSEIRKPYKPRGARECLREVLRTGPAPWIAAARKSMAAGWQGVFPEKLDQARGAGPQRVDPLEEFLRRHGGEGESAA